MHIHHELSELLLNCAHSLGADIAQLAAIERPRNARHGDYASSLALKVAKQLSGDPRKIAAEFAAAAADHPAIVDAAIAGAGFVNMRLTDEARCDQVAAILAAQNDYGRGKPSGRRVLLEFISANPTGPLHVGHGRAAATGDSIARIMRFAGDIVETEYYLNDRGLQIDILAASLWLRVCQRQGKYAGPIPVGAYAGEYLADCAADFLVANPDFCGDVPNMTDLPATADDAAQAIVARTKSVLKDRFDTVRDYAVVAMTANIKVELEAFGVQIDNWFSERQLDASGAVDAALAQCEERGAIYRKDNAVWFKASAYGDEQDWVVVRGNGEKTYFSSDIAYHLDKCKRGYNLLCNLFGADHHGYLKRLAAVLKTFNEDPAKLKCDLIQFVAIVNAGERLKMSTRSGTFLALQKLVDAVGVSATRLGFVLSKSDTAMEFDVAKAGRQSAENPVYYMQYAHARSCSLLKRWGGDITTLQVDPKMLTGAGAEQILAELRWFVPTLEIAARERAPHRIAHWLLALAGALHSFYDKVPILSGPAASRDSLIALVAATRQALANGLGLLGVEAPTKM